MFLTGISCNLRMDRIFIQALMWRSISTNLSVVLPDIVLTSAVGIEAEIFVEAIRLWSASHYDPGATVS